MPIYTYRCESCGVQFERHQSFSDEPMKRCPECSKNSLRKVLTPAGIIFKGSGWYATDHKSPSGAPRPVKAESKEGSSSSSSSESASSSSSEGSNTPSKSESSNGSTSKSDSASKSSE
jgi:putative FmdB family regulatory protein